MKSILITTRPRIPFVHMIHIILGKQLKRVWGTDIYIPCNQGCVSVPRTFLNLLKNSENYWQIYGIGYIHFYIILLVGLGIQPLRI